MAKKVKAPAITQTTVLKLRKSLGLNQAQFWSRIGVTQSGGSRYESGRTIPKPVKKLIYLMHFSGLGIDLTPAGEIMAAVK